METTAVSLRQLAKQFHVSEKSILQARDLLAEAPDLAAQVEACSLSLAAASEQLQARRKQAAQKARDAARIAEFRDAISNGEMTPEEAMQAVMEQERREVEERENEASARRLWLEGLAGTLDWLEQYVATRTDEHLAWYTLEDAPGADAHDITADKIAGAVVQLRRVQAITFGSQHERHEREADSNGEGKKTP